MPRKIENIRNIGIIAHIDAGKTTVTEHMLHESGATHRAGRVDHGTTTTDDDPEEQTRGITIYSACMTFDWGDTVINLLDTPGHVDFTAEVERCLRVLDGAVVVFSAREGVEAQSETVWRQADRYQTPRIVFINKMDREGADFEAVFEQIQNRLDANPIAIQIPLGCGPAHIDGAFRGVIDLIEMELLVFEGSDRETKCTRSPIPEEELANAELWRDRMLESLYDYSNPLMELALQEEPIPAELVRSVLRDATLHLRIQPLLCGSALHKVGIPPLLDAVTRYLPSPLERPPVEGQDLKGKVVRRKPNSAEPFCGLVFKIIPAKTGDMYWVRVYSGELKANSRAINPGKNKKENISQLWYIHATKKDREGQIERVGAGDIVGVIGPRHSITGDTLCDAKHPLLLESIQFPETVISMAIEPETTAERKKLSETLDMLRRQDPTVKVFEGESGQTLISGMGELHLEVIKNKLLRDFKLKVKFHKPQVSYRETITQTAEVVGECHRLHAGKQLFARLCLKIEPFAGGTKAVAVASTCPAESLDPEFLAAALEELRERGQGGGNIYGFPLSKIKVTVTDAEQQGDASDEMAFRIAASDAFSKALDAGHSVLLEPIMKVNLVTPEEHLGELVNDLQQRRAIIAKTATSGGTAIIEAHAPLDQLFGYSSAMRSLSQGRAGCSMEPLEYAPAPAEVMKKYLV